MPTEGCHKDKLTTLQSPPPTGLRLQPVTAGGVKVLSITHCHDELKRVFVDSNWGLVFLHHLQHAPVIQIKLDNFRPLITNVYTF